MVGVLEQGAVIADRFAIESLVAQGGMGAIYRAFDRVEGRPVALKIIDARLGSSQDTERFVREAETLARLDHARIVRYLNHGQTQEGAPFLAMQWLDGEDLKTALGRGRLALKDAISVLRGAVEALAVVHEKGIVHRDLKPGNLFLRGGSIEDVVLLDFGIARRAQVTQRLTASGMIVGTPHYMAPEQASGVAEVQAAADVFALGCIFYECLTGKTPFDAAQLVSVLARILFDEPEPVRTLRPSTPKTFAALLARMLDKDPTRRPRDASTLLREIAALPAWDETDETLELATRPAPDEGDEQALVCVVLASPACATATDAEGLASETLFNAPQRLREAQSALLRFGFAVEGLADGSLIATLSARGAATDQARIAARGALHVREIWPEARIAVATGRAPLGSSANVGEAADRAARILERSGGTGHPEDREAIWLDSVTVGLLDARFLTSSVGDNVLLRGERQDADSGRLLLGKPTPCVGREFELAQLDGLLSRAIDDAATQAAIILAPPGAGKSRLRHEFMRRARGQHPEAELLVGYGDPLTVGSPYGLLGDALRRHLGIRVGDEPGAAREALEERLCRYIERAERRRVGEFLGELCGIPFSAEGSPPLQAARSDPRVMREQITQAFLDWLTAECSVHPVVLVLEDVQWGDALTVSLLEIAFRDCRSLPLLVLVLGRPEVEVAFPGLLADHAQAMALRPMSRKASERLVRAVLGDSIEPDAMARVVKLADGNALFLEELIRAVAEGKAGDVPETVLAMLQVRLSRLAPEARRVLRAASILGETFWRGGVQRICDGWAARDDTDRWLTHLVDAELVERRRQSRFPAETEYGFRHALVRDAAYGLLTEADRRWGHQCAVHWLKDMGEADAMALAGHAQEGGDTATAIASYTAAAEQSLDRNDLGEALARAKKGAACGAEGAARGALLGIQAIALFGLGKSNECRDIGTEALCLLPHGGVLWLRTAEKLVHAALMLGDIERWNEVCNEIKLIEPAREDRAAHVCALSMVLFTYTIHGAREQANRLTEAIMRSLVTPFEQDAYARATAELWCGTAVLLAEPDPHQACAILERSVHGFEQGLAQQNSCVGRSFLGAGRSNLGDGAGAEAMCRSAVALAERMRDPYQLANARYYLSWVLGEHAGAAELEEAERLARQVLEVNLGLAYECAAWGVLTTVALVRREWSRAEEAGRRANKAGRGFPVWELGLTSGLMPALVQLGRAAEAAAIARERLRQLEQLGGLGIYEVSLLVIAAEALFEGGEREEAHRTLREALRQIDLRASRIPDATARDRYLQRNKDNLRAFELARAWLGAA